MKPPRPKLWHLLLLVLAVACLLNQFRPFGPRDAIRIALPAVRKEYPGLAFDERSASASPYKVANFAGSPAWNVKYSGPTWEVLIVVDSNGTASRPCWFPVPNGRGGATIPEIETPPTR